MFEKEREIQVLCDRLQRTEMELATLKMERLRVGTHQSVSQSIYTDTVEPLVGVASVNPLGSFGQDSKPVITTLPVWSAGSVRQSHVATSATTTPATITSTAVTTAPLFQPGTQDTDLYTITVTKSSNIIAA